MPLALECEGRSFWEIFQNAFPSSSMVALSTSPVCLQNRLHQKKLRFCKICCWQPHTWKPLTMNNPTSWQTYSVTNLLSFPSLRCCNLNVAQKKTGLGKSRCLTFTVMRFHSQMNLSDWRKKDVMRIKFHSRDGSDTDGWHRHQILALRSFFSYFSNQFFVYFLIFFVFYVLQCTVTIILCLFPI